MDSGKTFNFGLFFKAFSLHLKPQQLDDVKTTASDIQLRDQQCDASDDSEQVQEYNTDSDVSEDLNDDSLRPCLH